MNNKTIIFFNSLFKESDERNSILDPLTCLVRLSILSFKPEGTKISVAYNSIRYCRPSIIQGFIRWSWGDNREDLHNLFNPIKKAIEWYNITLPEIKGICEFAILGIELLMKSYKPQSIICHSLEHYIHILEYSLEQSNNNDNLSQSTMIVRDDISKFQLLNSANSDSKYSSVYTNLRDLWNSREISIIYNLLMEMSKLPENDTNICAFIDSVDSILNMKEQRVRNIIVENMTILE